VKVIEASAECLIKNVNKEKTNLKAEQKKTKN